MQLRGFRNFLLIILLVGGNAYAQTQLPKCMLFGFGNCIGTLRFSNGDIYTGEFNYGKPNGKGEFTYGNGDSYNGTVVEGQRHGSGTYTSAAGDKYVGQFSEGKFQGIGTYYFLANNRSRGDIYVGEFSSNTFNGQGRYTHSNGQVFVGGFVNGRKSVPIVAPETLLAQAEVQRLAEENAKQKAQLEGQLEAERRERLVREKQAATAVIAKQDVQVAPIASPALAMVVPAGDKAAPQPIVVLAKSDSVPANVELVGKDSESKDSAVKSPQATESRAGEQVTAYGERSKWYLTGGVTKSVTPSYVTCTVSCSKSMNPWGISIGAGYDLTKYWAVEAEIASVGSETVTSSSAELKADYYVLMFGGVLSFEIAPKTQFNIGGGYYRSLIASRYSSTTSSSSQSLESENSFVSLGAAYQLNYSTSLRLKWSILNTKQYSAGETDMYQGLGLGIKYNF